MTAAAKILVVDDEPSVGFFLENVLTRDGHQVKTVDSGEAALASVAEEDFDLVLLDLKLKGIGGMEVLATLREQSPDTAVIVLTAYASLETAVEALRYGAHDYLFKPAKTVELRESVRSGLLKRRRELRRRKLLVELEHSLSSSLDEIRSSVVVDSDSLSAEEEEISAVDEEPSRFLQQRGLIVDFMRHIITLDGELLELSPTEFDLLAYLISESPRVISPQELVREIQGYESEPWEARDMIRYHIYRIRRKIKDATGRKDIISTVRGVGYVIEE